MPPHLGGRPVAHVIEEARAHARACEDCRGLLVDLLDHIDALTNQIRTNTGDAHES